MAKTIVGLYDNHDDAKHAKKALLDKDFKRNQIELIDKSGDADRITNKLTDAGVPKKDAENYAEGVRRGSALVMATGKDRQAQSAVSVLNQFNPVDLDRRVELWREEGTKGTLGPEGGIYTSEEIESQSYSGETLGEEIRHEETYSDTRQKDILMGDQETVGGESGIGRESEAGLDGTGKASEQEKLEVAEEELHVGKREVESGGIRARTYVSEEPVEEDVHLKEERVDVERRPVDRDVSATGEDVFKEGEVEFTEIREEPVVQKRVHVIEEVVITKDVGERTETISDTVRRQDVDIEQIGKEYDQDFRGDYQQRYASSGSDYSYDDYSKGYRYGASLGTHSGYQDKEWHQVEPEAREQWESRNQGTWEDFKDTVRTGWEKVRGKGRSEESRPMA
ncbi:MAG: DUF2382 domain-containing protein [Bradymonadaceae bacterium]